VAQGDSAYCCEYFLVCRVEFDRSAPDRRRPSTPDDAETTALDYWLGAMPPPKLKPVPKRFLEEREKPKS